MSSKTKIVKSTMTPAQLEEVYDDKTQGTNNEVITNEKSNKVKELELELLVKNLSSKVTVLTDKVHELNETIVSLMTLQEEILYTVEQGDLVEDKNQKSIINLEEKKFSLN